jgi:hypothetical protein
VDLETETAYVGRILDAYGAHVQKVHVAAADPEDGGVPDAMRAGEVDIDGWVPWKLLTSTLTEADVAAVERRFGIDFPPVFRGYLLARFHLFQQVRSNLHDQQVLIPATPSHRPLDQLSALLAAWHPLIDAGYIPFAEWGDGWGPMCFDVSLRAADGDCPVVWFDHDLLVTLGEEASIRPDELRPISRPLYGSCREFVLDVFGPPVSS